MSDIVFAVNDRVQLRRETAENWLDAKIRRRAKLGREGTVTHIIGTALAPKDRSYRVDLDCVGREKPLSEVIPVQDLEAVTS